MNVPLVPLAAAAAAGYVALSVFLLKRKPKQGAQLRLPAAAHISHRGGAGENVENTLDAFQKAVRAGTDMVELDVFYTRDGQVVVSHDSSLERLTGHNISIKDTAFADIPPYQQHIPKGHFSNPPGDCSAGRVCLLETVFQAIPTVPIHLEIKQYDQPAACVRATGDLICKYERERLTAWGSFSTGATGECAEQFPNIPRYFSLTGTIWLLCMFYSGLLPFLSFDEACLSIPMLSSPHIFAEGRKRWYLRWLLNGIAFVLESPILYNYLQNNGVQIFFWVLNKDDDFDRAFNVLKVDGVMTDFPTKLSSFLADKE